MTARKKYKSIVKKTREKHNHIPLLSKTNLNTIEVLISKALCKMVEKFCWQEASFFPNRI